MPDFVRRIVSGPKARYVDPKLGFDLDLVYVTDRLIIMGWPASNFEALYRNRRKDVRKFLDAKHGEHYRVYNLCPCTENTYEADEFYGAVSRYPFPDHHPPPLSMIPMFVADITAFFAENPSNVAIIHCKAGKGRSGTMACSYLLSLPILPPSPQSSRNCGNKHDRKLLEEKRKANKEAAIAEANAGKNGRDISSSKGEGAPDANGQFRLVLPADNHGDDNHDFRMKELTTKLNAVFEFHTSRRLKPAKSSTSSSNRAQTHKSTSIASDFDDTEAPIMVRSDSDQSDNSRSIRSRKSLSNLVGSLSRKVSRIGLNSALKSEELPSTALAKSTNAKHHTHSNSPRLHSRSTTNLRALGVAPAGKSRTNLSDHLEPPLPPLPAGLTLRRQSDFDSDPWASTVSLNHSGSSEQLSPKLSRIVNATQSNASSSYLSGSPSNVASPEGSDLDMDEERSEDVSIPRLAVSIPSQRRWVGYWARMLAGMDPRAAFDSNMMLPSRRTVKIRNIYVDRRASSSDVDEGHLSVHIVRYNQELVNRLETWERGARRRQRAFGALDPGAPSPSLSPSEVDNIEEANNEMLQRKDEERRWRECEKRNREHRQEYNRILRQHGNDIGVGQWGINVMAERDVIRHYHWEDEEGSLLSQQMETMAMVSETARYKLSKKEAEQLLSNTDLNAKATEEACILRYVFEPGSATLTQEGKEESQMIKVKSSSAIDGFSRLLHSTIGTKKVGELQSDAEMKPTSKGLHPPPQSPSNTSSDTWPSQLSATSPSTSGGIASSTTSDEDGPVARFSNHDGVVLDADREIQFKILVGRSGATHAKLPDMLSAGYLWFIPAFETPIVNGKTAPNKGQVVKCQFGVGEIDFRKGKKAAPLMGGGDIRSITVEFEWTELGWHEADED